MDAVLTTWPTPCSIISGTNVEMPWMTPTGWPEDPAPVLLVEIPDRAAQPDPRVVVDEVHGPEAVERLVPQGPDGGAVGHVGHHPDGLGTPGGELTLRFLEWTLLDVGDDDLHPFGRSALRHRATDAAGTAGDHRHPAL